MSRKVLAYRYASEEVTVLFSHGTDVWVEWLHGRNLYLRLKDIGYIQDFDFRRGRVTTSMTYTTENGESSVAETEMWCHDFVEVNLNEDMAQLLFPRNQSKKGWRTRFINWLKSNPII